jgi:hypothetical protein
MKNDAPHCCFGPAWQHWRNVPKDGIFEILPYTAVPGSLDKKGGRKIPFMCHFCLIKDGTVVPLFCLTNPAL